MLAPMIRQKPVAIAKNETREEMSRIVGKEVKSTLQHQPGQSSLYMTGRILQYFRAKPAYQ